VISWRYHVVSLVAVVLAFGLGILAGTSVIDEGLVDEIQRNYTDAVQQRDAARADAAFAEEFIQSLQPTLRDDALLGEEGVVITLDGVDGPAQRAAQELEAAGVEVVATLSLTRSLAETENEENASVLETILGLPAADPEGLRQAIAEAFAIRLDVGVLPGEDDVLGRLLEEGFVTADRDLDAAGLLSIGGTGQIVVIVAGGVAPEGFPTPEDLLVPLTDRLVRLGVPTTAAGPSEDAYGFVTAVRGAPEIPDCSLVTVDDLDLEGVGGITMVMGIDRLLADEDPVFRPGADYGVRGDSMMVVVGADEPPQSCRE
jgi:hypothetical protein